MVFENPSKNKKDPLSGPAIGCAKSKAVKQALSRAILCAIGFVSNPSVVK